MWIRINQPLCHWITALMAFISASVSHCVSWSPVLGLESDGQQMPCKPTLICLIDMSICAASAHLMCQLVPNPNGSWKGFLQNVFLPRKHKINLRLAGTVGGKCVCEMTTPVRAPLWHMANEHLTDDARTLFIHRLVCGRLRSSSSSSVCDPFYRLLIWQELNLF